jgi:predicted transcriptional regulator
MSTHELEKLDLDTNCDLWETFDNLSAQQNNMTKGDCDELQNASCMNVQEV